MVYLKAPPLAHSLCTSYHSCSQYFTFHDMQFHFYAADNQLDISSPANDDLELTNNIAKIEECPSGLDKEMSLNKPKLDGDKTKLFCFYQIHSPQ